MTTNTKISDFLKTTETNIPYKRNHFFHNTSFVDKTLSKTANLINTGFVHVDLASKNGLMQLLDARIKVLFMLFFIVLVSIIGSIEKQLIVSSIIIVLFGFSRISILHIYSKILILGFVFGFLVVLPASLNVFQQGTIIFPIIELSSNKQFWIYLIPKNIGVTYEGSFFVLKFFVRLVNSLSLTFLIFYTTPFNDIIKSLKMLKVPDLFLMVILLTWKFLFILSQTVEETYMALKSRWWERTHGSQARQIVAGRILFIYRRAWIKYDETYKAMISRGYNGHVQLLYASKIGIKDTFFIGFFVIIGILLLLL